MNKTIHLTPDMVPSQLRRGYSGRKFQAIISDTVNIPAHAGLWSGGSRDIFKLVNLATGEARAASDDNSVSWSDQCKPHTINLRPGFAVVEHTIFCGKDLGLRFYVHPADAAKLLPALVEIDEVEAQVLEIVASLKSFAREDEARHRGISPSDYADAKARLIERKLLNRAGAITVAGRNARPSRY